MSGSVLSVERRCTVEKIRHCCDDLNPRDILDRLFQSPQCARKRALKNASFNDRVGNEGKRLAAERLSDERRVEIDDPVAESFDRAGAPVMYLVGMQDVALTREADPSRAPVPERLHARQRNADRIGVVAVRRKRLSDEARFQPLDPRAAVANPDAIERAFALAFKMVRASAPSRALDLSSC